MRLLVTGAGGMLGRDVMAAATRAGHEAHGLMRAELDVTDARAVALVVEQAAPEAIINCAAWTDVDGAESNEPEALAVNAAGPRNLAQAGPFLVHVSTDYVFDGSARRPYLESDPTGPRSAYGRTKLAGERPVLEAGGAVARTAWLFGAGGRNFVKTMLGLGRERAHVDVVSDQVGCPTYTAHLAPALIALAEQRRAGIQHLAATGSCSWMDFARAIFSAAGVRCEVRPATSAQMARPAPRPAWSVLASEREGAPVLPSWQDGLTSYLEEAAA